MEEEWRSVYWKFGLGEEYVLDSCAGVFNPCKDGCVYMYSVGVREERKM